MQKVNSYGSHCDVVVELPLTGKTGAAGTGPCDALDAALRAAGMKATVNASTSVVYNPETFHDMTDCPTCTVYVAEYLSDGSVKVQKTTGVRWSMVLNAADAAHVKLTFTGIGQYSDTTEGSTTAPSNPAAYSEGKSPILSQGMSFSHGAESFDIIDFSLDLAWTIEEDRGINGATSLKGSNLRRSEDSPIVASLNFRRASDLEYVLGVFKADTEGTVSCPFTDGTDTVTLAGQAQFGQYSKSKANVLSYACPLMFVEDDGGDDDITLTFT
jgi:hypothetical protein